MSKKSGKRKRGDRPMIDGDIDSAMVVTPETIYINKKDGSRVAKQIWVSLDKPNLNNTAVENLPEIPEMPFFNDPADMPSTHPEPARRNRVSIHQ